MRHSLKEGELAVVESSQEKQQRHESHDTQQRQPAGKSDRRQRPTLALGEHLARVALIEVVPSIGRDGSRRRLRGRSG